MVRVETESLPATARRISRKRLLRRVAVAGGALYAAPIMTSTAYADGEHAPNCHAFVTPEGPVTCGPDPCAGQTICRGEIPPGSFCTCVPRCPGEGNENGLGQCFCHEVQFCEGLTPCESAGDCPPGWACTESCCPGGCFCLPPCGTNPIFGTTGELLAAVGSGSTSVG
jgi:hypothetical protein